MAKAEQHTTWPRTPNPNQTMPLWVIFPLGRRFTSLTYTASIERWRLSIIEHNPFTLSPSLCVRLPTLGHVGQLVRFVCCMENLTLDLSMASIYIYDGSKMMEIKATDAHQNHCKTVFERVLFCFPAPTSPSAIPMPSSQTHNRRFTFTVAYFSHVNYSVLPLLPWIGIIDPTNTGATRPEHCHPLLSFFHTAPKRRVMHAG